jgi:hypothetical protein
MAFPILAAVAAGATAAKGGANAYFANQQRQALLSSQRDQVRQQNRLGRLQDQIDFDAYMRQVNAETEAYELNKQKADRQIAYNNTAYQRVIESGLTKLSDLSDNYIAKAQNRRAKLSRSTGVAAAKGMTGVTADRADVAMRAAAGRQEAMEGASKERAVGQYIFNTNVAKEQVEAANYRAWSEVAIPPTFGPPPVSRGMLNRPADTTGAALMSDLVGVAADTAMSFVSNMPTKATTGNGFEDPRSGTPAPGPDPGTVFPEVTAPPPVPQAGLADASGRSSLLTGPAQYFTSQAPSLGQFFGIPGFSL